MKVVLITGCSSGFGKMFVGEFLKNGYHVCATMRRAEERAAIFQEEKKRFGEKLQILNFDVTSKKDLEAVVREIEKLGRLDCLINNAGFGVYSALEDAGEDQVRAQIEINITGLILTTRALLPFLRTSKGHLINFSSVLGFAAMPLTSLYCMSKYAVEGLSESLYYELLPHGVRVSIVEPGSFATDFKENIIYGEKSDSSGSPYLWQSRNYRTYHNNMKKNAADPQVVVDAVMKAVEQKNPALRIRVGRDTKALYFMKSLLPAPLFRVLMTQFVGMRINKR